MRRFAIVGVLACALLFVVGIAGASTPGGDVRLTNDCHPDPGCGAGYVSDYTLATGVPYTDQTLDECTISKGRENEPSVGVDPRNTNVLLGSSNDYCGVYNRGAARGRCRADLARLLPIAGRRLELDELARAGIPGRQVSIRGALAGSHCVGGRSRDRVGQPRPSVLRLGELR